MWTFSCVRIKKIMNCLTFPLLYKKKGIWKQKTQIVFTSTWKTCVSMDKRVKEEVKHIKMKSWEKGTYMLDYLWDLIWFCQLVWEFVPIMMWVKCAKPNKKRKNFASELLEQKNNGWKDDAKTRHLKLIQSNESELLRRVLWSLITVNNLFCV